MPFLYRDWLVLYLLFVLSLSHAVLSLQDKNKRIAKHDAWLQSETCTNTWFSLIQAWPAHDKTFLLVLSSELSLSCMKEKFSDLLTWWATAGNRNSLIVLLCISDQWLYLILQGYVCLSWLTLLSCVYNKYSNNSNPSTQVQYYGQHWMANIPFMKPNNAQPYLG